MMRILLATGGGFLVWFVTVFLLNLVLRAALPGYVEAEPQFTFTLGMQAARLIIAAIASLTVGAVVTRVAQGDLRASRATASLLILLFLPVHYGLWDKFPLWYHLIFLGSLYPLIVTGARFVSLRLQ